MRDVRGGAALRPPLPPLLHLGEVREGQRRSGGVLLPDEERLAVAVHVTPRLTDSTREFENLSNETEELCSSSFFRIYVTFIWSYQQKCLCSVV